VHSTTNKAVVFFDQSLLSIMFKFGGSLVQGIISSFVTKGDSITKRTANKIKILISGSPPGNSYQ
jgi:hypothetical protein